MPKGGKKRTSYHSRLDSAARSAILSRMGKLALGAGFVGLAAAGLVSLAAEPGQAQVPLAPPPEPAPAPAPVAPAAPVAPKAPVGPAEALPAPPPAPNVLEEDAAQPALREAPEDPESEPPRSLRDARETEAPARETKGRSRRPRSPKPQLPEDFALHSSPWVDVSITNFWLSQRTGQFFNLGAQVGGYFAERLRVAARVILPLEEARDEGGSYDDYSDPSGSANMNYVPVASEPVSFLYGATVGVALLTTKTFVMSPGITLVRTDVGDYGTVAALSLPFEWTTSRRLRLGFEVDLGRAFGGTIKRSCSIFNAGGSVDCGTAIADRRHGAALIVQFHMGWALSAPDVK